MKVKLLGLTTKKYIEKQINICAAAGKLSRMPGTVFDAVASMKEYDKALKFVKRVIAMGHTATIDHDYIVFALSEVSPIVEQTIIEERFSSFTIKSRREVDFSNVGFYVPTFRDNNSDILKDNFILQKKYKKHMKELFGAYKTLVENNIPKEDARFILPYSYHSEILMGLDGTSLVRMIVKLTKGKCSKVSELKELGEKLYEVAKERAPYIVELIDNAESYVESELETLLKNKINQKHDYLNEPKLLSYTKDLDDTLFINAIARIYSLNYDKAKEEYELNIKNNEVFKEKLMKAIFKEPEHEDLKQVNMRFQLSIPFAILTHYTRHRRLSLSIPDFFPNLDLNKYETPPSIKTSNILNYYKDIFNKNYIIYQEFKNAGVCEEDLVYFTLSGNLANVIINFDGESFRWICRLRECTKAQWCIRYAVVKMHKEISKISKYYASNLGPDCVTKNTCGEGKESCGRINNILAVLNKR